MFARVVAIISLLSCACGCGADGPVVDLEVGLGIVEFKIDMGAYKDPVLRVRDRVTTLIITEEVSVISVSDGEIAITATAPVPTTAPPTTTEGVELTLDETTTADEPARPADPDPVTSGCARDARIAAEGAIRDNAGVPILDVRVWHSNASNRDWGQATGRTYGRLVVSLPSKGNKAVCLPADCSEHMIPIGDFHTMMIDGDVPTSACAWAISPRDQLRYQGCLRA
ncbi:hypothetical protein V5P93_003665 [Actinokineospora auranticolor]|uniref:Uncharacterized protein n=1 Tax=Actinokineospora auranticolor TaxID=155976 RepID=A0A2S6GJ40_9PSEU|nr:hypothetical protein [Actinokineospora auranticolor]PPK65227.1 hypothetical protein CLV40_11574 [Actinokineospora auranticolor]